MEYQHVFLFLKANALLRKGLHLLEQTLEIDVNNIKDANEDAKNQFKAIQNKMKNTRYIYEPSKLNRFHVL